jgi:hypothetical protein
MLLVDLGTTGSAQLNELSIVGLIVSRHAGVTDQALPGRGGSHRFAG